MTRVRRRTVRRKQLSSSDAFSASRGLLKGKLSTTEFLKSRRQERARETKAVRPIIVRTCEQTCKWVPSQWEGVTTDDRPIYVRYRHGYLSVRVGRVGRPIEDAIRSDQEVVGFAIGDELDGFITYQGLRRHTKGVITWPRKR